ncbi:MAG: hypothetical protein L6V79_06330 [Clostridium sp.]|nr:MAG: hypothetical protein L6V79_06330 [Clostridium sp.]
MRGKTFTRIRIKSDEFRGVSTTKDEAISSPTSSPMSYNFTYEKGVLQGKYGISAATFPSDVTPAFRHAVASLPEGVVPMSLHLFRKFDAATNKRDDRLIVRTTDNEYYETSVFTVGDTFRKIVNLAAAGKDCSACYRYNGKDLFLASSERGFFYTYDGTTLKKIENAPKMTSMCVHAERIFATVSGEQNKVWFSADFNPENWKVSGNGAGYIDFDDEGGKVIKVVKFLNYVYVFRDFGVERLTAFGAQTDFSVSKIYTASARIYPDTIVPLGDRIVFLTEEGLKCLDGYNVQNIFADLSDFLSKDKRNAVATGMDGKYFSCRQHGFSGGLRRQISGRSKRSGRLQHERACGVRRKKEQNDLASRHGYTLYKGGQRAYAFVGFYDVCRREQAPYRYVFGHGQVFFRQIAKVLDDGLHRPRLSRKAKERQKRYAHGARDGNARAGT